MKFYLGGAWHCAGCDQSQVGRDRGGFHSIDDFMTEAIPLLQSRGLDVQPCHWNAKPDLAAEREYWGVYYERDGFQLEQFLELYPAFDLSQKWFIARFHTALGSGGENGGFNERFLEHINVMLGLSEQICDALWKRTQHPCIDVCPWGVATYWKYPPPQPSLYVPGTRNIVYAARLCPVTMPQRFEIFREIVRRDPSVRIHVITPSEIGPEHLPEGVVFHGAMQSGTFNHFLYYADLALDMAQQPSGQISINCKVWSYLGMGAPVVAQPVHGSELVIETGHGIVTRSFETGEYVDAVFSALSQEWGSRDEVIRYMQKNHGWNRSAEVLEKYIRLGQERGYDRRVVS